MANSEGEIETINHISSLEAKKLYESVRPKYEQLGTNIERSLKLLLLTSGIDTFIIEHRTKTFDSFLEKIGRKGYNDPLHQMEDICGVRIVCYYRSDLEKIDNLIKEEFEVNQAIDKSKSLKVNEFGYRSNHYIVYVNSDWLPEPSHRGLGNLRAEIQVRTILEHAWSDIQHKLQYKDELHVPLPLQRKLSRLMALIEDADESFDAIRREKIEYLEKINEDLSEDKNELEKIKERNLPLNIDTFRSVLSLLFPDRVDHEQRTVDLLNDVSTCNLSINDVIQSYIDSKKYIDIFDKDTEKRGRDRLSRPQMMSNLLFISNPKYKQFREDISERNAQSFRLFIASIQDLKTKKINQP